MTRNAEVKSHLLLLKECAVKSHNDTGIIDVKIDSFNFVIDMAIKALEQEPCENCVNLAEVYEIMGNLMSIPYDFDRNITEQDVSKSMDIIRKLPRVQPKTEWISVSERLPEKDDLYLINFDDGEYDLVYFCKDAFSYSGVIAWMPLPKPYEPQESEDKE